MGISVNTITGEVTQVKDSVIPPKTQSQIDAEKSAQAKAELAAIDIASIRHMREWIASQPTAPQSLKDREAAAITERSKIKP